MECDKNIPTMECDKNITTMEFDKNIPTMEGSNSNDNLVTLLRNFGVGQRPFDDPFFVNTYEQCKVFERKGVTVEDEEELCHEIMKEFPCNACSATFENLFDYELHYHDYHHFVCADCNKWRPTPRLLEIHIQETHDNYFKVLAEREPMYQCFVSECNVKFKNPIERREHCRKIHEFPKNYRYDDSANTKSTEKSKNNAPMDTNENDFSKKQNVKVQLKTKSMQKTFSPRKSNLTLTTDNLDNSRSNKIFPQVTMFIPRQVQQKSNNLTKNQGRNVLESASIMELGESLPAI